MKIMFLIIISILLLILIDIVQHPAHAGTMDYIINKTNIPIDGYYCNEQMQFEVISHYKDDRGFFHIIKHIIYEDDGSTIECRMNFDPYPKSII